jgi:glycosyltransferase involved in cell wall biosynthesis
MIYAKSADAIICPSEFTKNELIRTIGVNAQKINVIPNGVDHNLFKPRDKIVTRKRLGLPLDKRIVLHVGSELPRKNIDTLIKAFQILSTRMPKKVLLVRVGQQTNKMKKLIKSYNLEEFILHFNVRPRNELPYFFNAADVAVYPSTYEGFGIPPLEAMASGCPIITGNRTSLPEVVGDAGILVDPLDDKLMAEKIEMVLENHKLREDLIMKGIKRAATYTWEKCAEAHINFYRRVAMLSG